MFIHFSCLLAPVTWKPSVWCCALSLLGTLAACNKLICMVCLSVSPSPPKNKQTKANLLSDLLSNIAYSIYIHSVFCTKKCIHCCLSGSDELLLNHLDSVPKEYIIDNNE